MEAVRSSWKSMEVWPTRLSQCEKCGGSLCGGL